MSKNGGCQLYSCELEGHRPYFRLLLPVCRTGTGREELWVASPGILHAIALTVADDGGNSDALTYTVDIE